jgi:glutamate 5-kinase
MNPVLFRKELGRVKTIVVKTGSRILTAGDSDDRIGRLTEDIVTLHTAGIRVLLVSSGAIAHGMLALGKSVRPSTIPLQQAYAAIGQNRLMNRYQSFFERHGVCIGQVLLTWDDLRSKKRYLNLRNTLFALLDNRIIPILNENDSVGVEEIRFGTNDILSAQVAMLVQADVLVNLTDVGGLFTDNPRENPDARHVDVVSQMTSAVERMASDTKNDISVGGMGSKLKAAGIVTRSGISYLIGDGFSCRLIDVLNKDSCATLFLPRTRKMSSHHRWIAFSGTAQGSLAVDDGAVSAIREKGRSLLPAGVKTVSGSFKQGDAVDIMTPEKTVFARGLVNYSSDECRRIAGCKTAELLKLLGRREFDEIIHRDNLVLLQ